MNHFLIYWDDGMLHNTEQLNAALAELHAAGDMRPVTANVKAIATEHSGSEIQEIITGHAPAGCCIIVASISNMGYRGDATAGAHLAWLLENSKAAIDLY